MNWSVSFLYSYQIEINLFHNHSRRYSADASASALIVHQFGPYKRLGFAASSNSSCMEIGRNLLLFANCGLGKDCPSPFQVHTLIKICLSTCLKAIPEYLWLYYCFFWKTNFSADVHFICLFDFFSITPNRVFRQKVQVWSNQTIKYAKCKLKQRYHMTMFFNEQVNKILL